MPMFSVIIPTRARARTLPDALASVLNQSFGDFEVIVQDNASPPETRRVVEAFDDPRVIYRRFDRLVAMHDNWEAALDVASGGHVIFIGDDDALLPDGLALAADILRDRPEACLTWDGAIYGWPCHNTPERRNLLSLVLGTGWEEVESGPALRGLYAGTRGWQATASIYHGLTSRSVIEATRRRTGGRYFIDIQPDIGSSLTNLFLTASHLRSFEPLSLPGWSGHSNGGRAQTPEGNRTTLARLAAEAGADFGPWTALNDERLVGMGAMMLRTLANVRDRLGEVSPALEGDERSVLRWIMNDPHGIVVPFEVWRDAVGEHAARLGVPVPSTVTRPPSELVRQKGVSLDADGRIHSIHVDGWSRGFRSLGDAVAFAGAVFRRYRSLPDAIRP